MRFNLSVLFLLKETKDPLKKEYKFVCQHGKQECVGNIIDVSEMCSLFIIYLVGTLATHRIVGTRLWDTPAMLDVVWQAIF